MLPIARFEIPIYGLTAGNKKISLGTVYKEIQNAYRVGGTIFYIDSTASGATYTFYDSEANVLSDVRVGDTPYAYKVTGTATKDKYYVFNDALATGKKWTYQEEGAWIYTSLGTQQTLGSGKTNTTTVMNAADGKYVTQTTGGDTIWAVVNRLRTGAEGGCDDWFVPSKAEVDALRQAVDRDGDPLVSWFINNHIWSSSEYDASYGWYWNYNTQSWNSNGKNGTNGVFGARAF